MCDCVKRAEEQLTAKMQEVYPGREIIDPVRLSPRFIYARGFPLHFNCIGRVKYGKGVRKFDTYITLNYCPFCGQKLKQ